MPNEGAPMSSEGVAGFPRGSGLLRAAHKGNHRGRQSTGQHQQQQHPRVTVLQEMSALKEKLQTDIQHIEAKIFEMESDYLAAPSDGGNMIRGWEGYVSSSTKTRRPPGKANPVNGAQDRLFSLTSCTSQVWREFGPWTDDDQLQAPAALVLGRNWCSSGSAVSQTSGSSRHGGAGSSVRSGKRSHKSFMSLGSAAFKSTFKSSTSTESKCASRVSAESEDYIRGGGCHGGLGYERGQGGRS